MTFNRSGAKPYEQTILALNRSVNLQDVNFDSVERKVQAPSIKKPTALVLKKRQEERKQRGSVNMSKSVETSGPVTRENARANGIRIVKDKANVASFDSSMEATHERTSSINTIANNDGVTVRF